LPPPRRRKLHSGADECHYRQPFPLTGSQGTGLRDTSRPLRQYPKNERNLRLNKNLGEFDYDLLVQFDESFLKDIGFDSDKLDGVFEKEGSEKNLRPRKKLEKLDVEVINVTKAMPMT